MKVEGGISSGSHSINFCLEQYYNTDYKLDPTLRDHNVDDTPEAYGDHGKLSSYNLNTMK
jgi:hypothetical protein